MRTVNSRSVSLNKYRRPPESRERDTFLFWRLTSWGGWTVDGEAGNFTESNLGRHFNHSVAGSWVWVVIAGPCLRERSPVGNRYSRSGRMKEKLMRLQVYPLDVLHRPSSSDCPGAKWGQMWEKQRLSVMSNVYQLKKHILNLTVNAGMRLPDFQSSTRFNFILNGIFSFA